MWIFFILLNFLPSTVLSENRQHTAKEVELILRNLNLSDYSKHIPPTTEDGGPVEISARISLVEMLQSTHKHYELVLDLFLQWQDTRLKFNSSLMNTPIALSLRDDEFLWQPDLWILDETSGRFQYALDLYTRLFHNGTVEYIRRLNLQMYCKMDLWYFPFDQQYCSVIFESYGYNTEQVRLKWKSDTIHYSKLHPNEYEILQIRVANITAYYGVSGFYDQLTLSMDIKRIYSHYITQDFLPYNLVVILSMTSLWIDHNCVPARVAIPLTVVFTLTKLNTDIKSSLPFTREPIFLQYNLNMSVVFVLCILFEYCIVTLAKVKDIKKKLHQKNEDKYKPFTIVGDNGYLKADFMRPTKSYGVHFEEKTYIIHPIDKICRVTFPILYVSYNILYFTLCAVNNAQRSK